MKFLAFSQTKLGSSFDITRARVGGASVIPLISSLLFSVLPSRRKVLGAKPKQAGKKEGGWGEGIFACPRFPPPPNFVPVKLARRLSFSLLILFLRGKFFFQFGNNFLTISFQHKILISEIRRLAQIKCNNFSIRIIFFIPTKKTSIIIT